MQHFHTKLPCQKLILRQTEWAVQNGPVMKNEILPLSFLVLGKFCFSLRLSYKVFI